MDAQLIIDPPASGAWNMAVDEALLRWADETGQTAVRFYQWAGPTLSLGYFQSYADRTQHTASASLPAVRRATGGGAIVHDRELTYSLVTPVQSRFGRSAQRFVGLFHESLMKALGHYGVSAQLYGVTEQQEDGQPFLCFQRRNELDVVIAGHKIAGSAQRRRRKTLLQHGSVLLAASRQAPELAGLLDLGAAVIAAELLETWSASLREALALNFTESSLPSRLQAVALEVQQERYANEAWTLRR